MRNVLKAFLLMMGLMLFAGHVSFADVPASSNPASGNDPWALFQLMMGVGSEIWYVIKIALLIAGVTGLVFIVLGLQKIRSHALDSQSTGHLRHGIILVILGGLLFGAPVLMMVTGNSLFGSAPAPVATQEQVNCQMVTDQYQEGCGICSGNQVVAGNGCVACPNGQYASNGACITCEGAYGSNAYCPCNGYISGGNCGTTCPPGSGASGNGNNVCSPCTAGYSYNNTCVANCPDGYGAQGGACVQCPNNEWSSNNACVTQCPGGQNPSGAGSCSTCVNQYLYPNGICYPSCDQPNMAPSNLIPGGPTWCPCNSGTGWTHDGTCTTCPSGEGSYKDACVPCTNGTITNGACVCTLGGTPGAQGCPCPAGSFSNGNSCVCINGGNFNSSNNCQWGINLSDFIGPYPFLKDDPTQKAYIEMKVIPIVEGQIEEISLSCLVSKNGAKDTTLTKESSYFFGTSPDYCDSSSNTCYFSGSYETKQKADQYLLTGLSNGSITCG